ncbi:2'-5'-oligoadenylate synthase 1-like [Lissotriton helveticus]
MAWTQGPVTLEAQLTESQKALELYQTPANKLDAWIEHRLQPNETFNSQVRDAIDRIATFLKENCFKTTKVHKVVKGGSSGKGTTLKNGSDADLVVFLSCFQSLQDQNKERGHVIEEIREMLNKCRKSIAYELDIDEPRVNLDPKGKLRQPRSLSFRIRSQKGNEAIDVDVLPAFDILDQVTAGVKPDPMIYISLIEACGGPGDFTPCFTELQRDFVKFRPAKLKSLIRLVKHWYKMYVKSRYQDYSLPHKYALELLTIYAWEQGSGAVDFRTEQGFCTLMKLLCQYQKLCVHWMTYYDFENPVVGDYVRKQLRKPRPVILDPADPTFIVGQGTRWDLVAAEAAECLRSACCKNGLGPIQPWNVPPETPIEFGSLLTTPEINLFVRNTDGRTYTFHIQTNITVGHLKKKIEERLKVPAPQQRLTYSERELEDQNSLNYYNIKNESTIFLLLRLRGGKCDMV